MSMPMNMMEILMGQNGGGGSLPLSPLAPSVPAKVSPQEYTPGPEEQKALAMFQKPKDENEVAGIKQGWRNFATELKKQPGWAEALVAMGAALSQPGDFGRNFAQGAAQYTSILARNKEKFDEKNQANKLQEFGILQQARGIDSQNKQVDNQTKQQELQNQRALRADELDERKFNLAAVESKESRLLAAEGLGLKKRELAIAESQSRSNNSRTSLLNALTQVQVDKFKKDMNEEGFFKTHSGSTPGEIFIKEKANELIRANPKGDKSAYIAQAQEEYFKKAQEFQYDPKVNEEKNRRVFNAQVKIGAELMKGDAILGTGVNPTRAAAQAAEFTTALTSSAAGNSDPALTKAKAVASQKGVEIIGWNPDTGIMILRKDGKISEERYK